MYVCTYTLSEGVLYPWRLEKAVTSSGTGITDDFEDYVGSENQAQVQCKSCKHS